MTYIVEKFIILLSFLNPYSVGHCGIMNDIKRIKDEYSSLYKLLSLFLLFSYNQTMICLHIVLWIVLKDTDRYDISLFDFKFW